MRVFTEIFLSKPIRMQAALMLKFVIFFEVAIQPVGFVRSPRQDKCNFKPGALYRTKANKCHDDDDGADLSEI